MHPIPIETDELIRFRAMAGNPIPPPEFWKTQVTLLELLSNTGGAPAAPPPDCWQLAWANEQAGHAPAAQRRSFVETLLALPPATERGARPGAPASTRILGRRAVPFPNYRIPHRVLRRRVS